MYSGEVGGTLEWLKVLSRGLGYSGKVGSTLERLRYSREVGGTLGRLEVLLGVWDTWARMQQT